MYSQLLRMTITYHVQSDSFFIWQVFKGQSRLYEHTMHESSLCAVNAILSDYRSNPAYTVTRDKYTAIITGV